MGEEKRKNYTDIAIAIAKINSHFEKDGIIPAIKKQTEKTNGRVSKLEQWRWLVVGGFIAISMTIGVPKVIEFIFAH